MPDHPEYTCAVCGMTYLRTQSDEEAMAEMQRVFGPQPADEELGIVCDDCWRAGLKRMGLPVPDD